MIDLSNNKLESLCGLEHLTRLKRLICNNNQISDLSPLKNLSMLIEIDLQGNPVSSLSQVIQTIVLKKDILVLNLKNSPLMEKVQSIHDFYASDNNLPSTLNIESKALLNHFSHGVLYRNQRVYQRVKSHHLSQQ